MRIRVDDSPFGPVTIHCKGPAGDFRVYKVRRLDTGEEVEPDSDEQVAEWEALARYAWDSKRGGRGRAAGVWAAVLAALLGAGAGVARAETPEDHQAVTTDPWLEFRYIGTAQIPLPGWSGRETEGGEILQEIVFMGADFSCPSGNAPGWIDASHKDCDTVAELCAVLEAGRTWRCQAPIRQFHQQARPPEPSCTVSLHLVSQSVERGRGNTATLLARSRDCCHSPWIWAVYGGARHVRLDVKGSVWEEVQAAALKREGHNGEYTQVEARRCGQAARVVVYWQERPEPDDPAGRD